MPAGTPRVISNRLSNELEKIVLSADLKDEFAVQGVDPLHLPPDRFDAFFRAEIVKWAKVVQATGAKPE